MGNFDSSESAFNFAVEYLKQISESLKMCSYYSSQDDATNWVKWLRNCYRQLSVKLEKEEMDYIAGKYDEEISLKEIQDDPNQSKHSNFRTVYFLMSPRNRNKNKSLVLYLLDGIEVKIRRKLQEKGMLLPSKSDPKFAILDK